MESVAYYIATITQIYGKYSDKYVIVGYFERVIVLNIQKWRNEYSKKRGCGWMDRHSGA